MGASMINDVNALSAPGALEAVAGSDCGVCLMHKKGEPATMQRDPHYEDVVREVREFLDRRIGAAMAAGFTPERVVVDPGFGFGKTRRNLALLEDQRGASVSALSACPQSTVEDHRPSVEALLKPRRGLLAHKRCSNPARARR
jgi:dihydropteroate synthase